MGSIKSFFSIIFWVISVDKLKFCQTQHMHLTQDRKNEYLRFDSPGIRWSGYSAEVAAELVILVDSFGALKMAEASGFELLTIILNKSLI